jgi:hypothetical protein
MSPPSAHCFPVQHSSNGVQALFLLFLYARRPLYVSYSRSIHLLVLIFPLAPPRLGFPTLNLAAPMAEYTYSSSYTTSSPGRPYTPPHSVFPAALMSLSAGEMSSDSTSGRTSRGSGLHSPNLSSVPRSVRYNPISVAAVTRPGRERKPRSSNSAPTASNEV